MLGPPSSGFSGPDPGSPPLSAFQRYEVSFVMAIERTLSILKPDVTRRDITGRINTRFEEAGLL